MPRRFDAVVFDWYATLGAPAENDWWLQMFSMIEEVGGVVPESARGGWTTPELEHPEASKDEAAYRSYEQAQLDRLLRASGLSQTARAELGPRIMELRDDEYIKVFPDVVELLEQLHADGTTLALCSNWSWDLSRHLAHNAVERYFDIIICSAIVGYRKPHPGIFDALLAELERVRPELQRSRIAFVGDDWDADVEGAASIGLTPIHLAREGCVVTKHSEVPCVTDLAELRQQLFGDEGRRGDTRRGNDAE
jgi:HAD superfamily hydrolase (TIGR01549 family)